MSNSKNIDIMSLRALRKASHLSNKIVGKAHNFLNKVEHKTTKIIINRAGSADAAGSTPLDNVFYENFPFLAPIYPSLPRIGQKPSVTAMTFLHPNGFYGGVATTLIVAAELANKLGYDLRVLQTTNYSPKIGDVLAFLRSNGIIIEPERFIFQDVSRRTFYNPTSVTVHKDDIFLASAWWDAKLASQLPLVKKFVYLIQDFEPIFYNNSDSYVMADSTYLSERFIPLCNTELMYKYFDKNNYDYVRKNGVWFEPAVPHQSATLPQNKNGVRKLFLYGRPSVHRNLYFTALQAVDLALQDERLEGQKWEIYCAGQADVPAVKFKSGHVVRNLGKMNLDDYYTFARSIDLAVSPMLAPHPNYPTLEFAALGAMVVSTHWQTKQDLSHYSKNILLSDPTPEAMAEKIVTAALTKDSTRLKNLSSHTLHTDWRTAIEKPLNAVVTKIKSSK